MSKMSEYLSRTIGLLRGRLLITCWCICCTAAPIHSALAETTLSDVYDIAGKEQTGKVRSVVGIRVGQKWANTPFTLLLGLEQNPRSKKRDISGFNVVVDASKMTGRIPTSCVQRFSVPWNVVKKRFPMDRSSGTNDYPETKDNGSLQVYNVNGKGCSVTLLIGSRTGFSGLADIARQYPGLSLKKAIDLLQEGEVEFDDGSHKTNFKFVVTGE